MSQVQGAGVGSTSVQNDGEKAIFQGGGVPKKRESIDEMEVQSLKREMRARRDEILERGLRRRPLSASNVDNGNGRHGDLADQSANNLEVHIRVEVASTEAKILQAIEDAIARMEAGTYGICVDCGDPIAVIRLRAIPWARICIQCKQKPASDS